MTITESPAAVSPAFETPFAESAPLAESPPDALGFLPWTEERSPFADVALAGETLADTEGTELLAEAFESLRDESFDEVIAELIAETAEAADVRMSGEQPLQLRSERERLADLHLAPIQFEAEQAVQRFIDGVQHLDVEGLAPEQLDEMLDRLDRGHAGVSPVGEEFIGGLIKKAKRVVKTVVDTAGKVAKAALPVLGPILNKLKALIRPLLRRVLAVAINRLPAALHQPARQLARRFGLAEAEHESGDVLEADVELEHLADGFAGSAVMTTDPEALGEAFDAALAESVLGGEVLEQGEAFGHDLERGGEPEAGTQLEVLAEARSAFIGQLQAAPEGEDLTPAIEQFIPAVLPALRLGIRLVGRPKVVHFLSGFLARLIGQWVGPKLSGPLSNAIVDVGLRLVGLEQGQPGELEAEAAPAALAAVVEDSVRRLSEQPEHVFEDEDLLRAAVTDSFEQALSANFPGQLLRPDLRIAPTVGGTFVVRHARTPFSYKKFSRVPEIELTEPVADSARTFGGATLAAALRAGGIRLPGRFRVHVYEAGPGTTLPRLARLERIGGGAHPRGAYSRLHPLTVAAAGALLREPKLGVDVPARFLESRHRIAVGQRFFFLEPIGQSPIPVTSAPGSRDATRPSDIRIRHRKGECVVALYFSEVDAQRLAQAAGAGAQGGGIGVLRMLLKAAAGPAVVRDSRTTREAELESEVDAASEDEVRRLPRRGAAPTGLAGSVRTRRTMLATVRTALAAFSRTRAHELVRAAQDPACGLTVLVRVRGLAGAPLAQVDVVPGRRRP